MPNGIHSLYDYCFKGVAMKTRQFRRNKIKPRTAVMVSLWIENIKLKKENKQLKQTIKEAGL
jgi:hypothetical protein